MPAMGDSQREEAKKAWQHINRLCQFGGWRLGELASHAAKPIHHRWSSRCPREMNDRRPIFTDAADFFSAHKDGRAMALWRSEALMSIQPKSGTQLDVITKPRKPRKVPEQIELAPPNRYEQVLEAGGLLVKRLRDLEDEQSGAYRMITHRFLTKAEELMRQFSSDDVSA